MRCLAVPDEPYYATQWQHENIRSAGAWDITAGSPEMNTRTA